MGMYDFRETIGYYNENAEAFCEATRGADMGAALMRFIKYLDSGALILDAGCGSGRDSKYFLEKGYRVEAFDGSERLCRLAASYIGQEVWCMTFKELDHIERYDGIWACASLLHVCREEMPEIMERLTNALKENGVLYASFKYGYGERVKAGRFFNDYDEGAIEHLLEQIDWLELQECFVTRDVRSGREEEKWLNVIGRKV